jgi:hypothetical protein
LLGCGVIVASGLYTLNRESQAAKQETSAAAKQATTPDP